MVGVEANEVGAAASVVDESVTTASTAAVLAPPTISVCACAGAVTSTSVLTFAAVVGVSVVEAEVEWLSLAGLPVESGRPAHRCLISGPKDPNLTIVRLA